MEWFVLIPPLLALGYATFLWYKLEGVKVRKKEVNRIGSIIKDGAIEYLKSEYRLVLVFVVSIAFAIYLTSSAWKAVAFLMGATMSGLAGYIGMVSSTKANSKTAEAAEKGLNEALGVAFSSGSILSMVSVGLGLLGIILFLIISNHFLGINLAVESLIGFAFGASSIALFARVGGGIYTKGADIGADIVGKVEEGLAEDDPRNPAVIADNVGDNVGDVAGMGADLFESYVGSIIASVTLGLVYLGERGIYLPLYIAGLGILSSLVGFAFVRVRNKESISSALWAMRKGIMVTTGLTIFLVFLLSMNFGLGLFIAVASGLIAGMAIGFVTEFYTSHNYPDTRYIAESSLTGPAINVISGLSVGMKSTAIPILIISGAMLIAYHSYSLFGVAIAAVGMLSTLGMTLASDAFGPVVDNAGGISQMAKLSRKTRKRTDILDSLGNTTAAVGKGFAMGSAALTSIALISTYIHLTGLDPSSIVLSNPYIVVGLFIGGMLPFIFSSMTIRAVGKTAGRMVEEVRRQFSVMSSNRKSEPDYARCIRISTNHALKEMVKPGVLAIISPIAVGIVLGPESLAAMLLSATVTGFLLAIFMANSGGAWDNAKKYIEEGNLGGKGTQAHKAAVVGDTVGDPFKDTSGPSLNILIKLMSIVSLVFSSLIASLHIL